MKDIKLEIERIVKDAFGKDIPLEVPPDQKLGDYAVPCFSLAKELKKAPQKIAEEYRNILESSIKKDKKLNKILSVINTGPYLNFFVEKSYAADKITSQILKEKAGFGSIRKKSQKVMVEFVSPNTNKSLHLGHVRNALLGESLSRVLEFAGDEVIRVCLNNDRGTGMSEAMLGYTMFHKGEVPKGKPDAFVAQCYVDFKKAEKDNPALSEKVKQNLLEWENNVPVVRSLWKKMTAWVYKGYNQTYKGLGIKFDKQYYESEIYVHGKEIVQSGIKRGIFTLKEGAVVAELEKYGLPNKILMKSDGTALYMTQDIYLAKHKEDEFGIDASIYVVASEQDNHFKQLFRILELLEFKFAKKCYHLSYGMISLPTGRMKSREGNVVDADDIMSEVISLAKKEVIVRHPEISVKEADMRARSIGMAALKFFILKYDNTTSFVYNPEESLSFEGDTGPYVQYAYARICSIMKKAVKKSRSADFSLLTSQQEISLLNALNTFPEAVENAAKSYRPSIIARYALDLAQKFNEFYHSCQILKEEEKIMTARLTLCRAVQQVLRNSFHILNIDACEEM